MKLITIVSILVGLSNALPIDDWMNLVKEETLPDALKDFIFEPIRLINNRIVGGSEAIPHAYPYTVGLSIFKNTGMSWCGASLITDQYILTAGHCVNKARDIIIYIGCHGTADKDCIKIKTNSKNVKIHEHFNATNLENDIALVKIPGSIIFNDNIKIISLPKSTENIIAGHSVTATGWGYYKDGYPNLSKVMRYVDVNIMKQEDCYKKFQGIPRETNICIDGSDGKSTCNGDSGGPLAYTHLNGDKILIGLSSFGAKAGCEKGWPAVFTRITSYLYWIQKNIKRK